MNICKIEGANNMEFIDIQNSFPSPDFNNQQLIIQNDDNYLLPSSIIQTSVINNVQELDFQAHHHYTSCTSSTSNEAEKQQQQKGGAMDDRKHRRMVSNRESARRSRMRKKRQVNELLSQMLWLKNENQDLAEKLNRACESHTQVVQENNELKEETSNLRQMVTHMQLGVDDDDDDLDSALRDFEGVKDNTTSWQ